MYSLVHTVDRKGIYMLVHLVIDLHRKKKIVYTFRMS